MRCFSTPGAGAGVRGIGWRIAHLGDQEVKLADWDTRQAQLELKVEWNPRPGSTQLLSALDNPDLQIRAPQQFGLHWQ